MNLDGLSNGQRISSISALLLFVLMFLDWFGTKSSVDSFGLFSVGRSAWEALDYIPVVLLIAIVATLVIAALSLANAIGRAFPPRLMQWLRSSALSRPC
jgi:amino acid transporter